MIRIAIVLALLAALVGAINWIPAHYIAVGVQQEKNSRAAADKKHLADDTAAALKKEREFATRLAASEAQRLKERENHAKDKAAAVATARAGNSGMRCPSARLQPDTTSAGGSAASPVGSPEDGRLVPEAAGDILDAAGSGVEDVRDYNELLDEYRKLATFCKAG